MKKYLNNVLNKQFRFDKYFGLACGLIAFLTPLSGWGFLVYKAHSAIPIGEWQALIQIIVLVLGCFWGLLPLWIGLLLATLVLKLFSL